MRKRSWCLFFVFLWGVIGLGGRLAYLALGTPYAAAAARQSLYTVQVDWPRGQILDCAGQPLTGRQTVYKTAATAAPAVVTELYRRFAGERRAGLLRLAAGRTPFTFATDRPFRAEGAVSFLCREERPTVQTAVHLAGCVNAAGQGVSGLQKAFDSLLRCPASLTVTYACDAAGGALAGLAPVAVRRPPAVPAALFTTLNERVQQAAERAFPPGRRGAVVVQKLGSGELAAAVSRPDYSPARQEEALNRADSPLLNRCFTAYNVGSVFKLCVAAAALEAGISPEERYVCSGSVLCGARFRCHNEEGHGALTMGQAMAASCNVYFIKLAQAVGAEAVVQMASKLGFGCAQQLCEGMTSEGGLLPTAEELAAPAALANLAIGQGRLLATPLQLATLVNTIASGGVCFAPYLVTGSRDWAGVQNSRPAAAGRRVMRPETAEQLWQMMQAVVQAGTGAAADAQTPGVTAGGKTATAQTGMVNAAGAPVTQAWFAGVCRAGRVGYAVSILVEEGDSGGADAAPVFAAFCRAVFATGGGH